MRILLFLIFFISCHVSLASSIAYVDTTLNEEFYVKYDSNLSPEENKEQAINLALLNSLENAFGKIITSSNDMTINNSTESKTNITSSTNFKSRTKSLVQGKVLKIIDLFYEKRISEKYAMVNGERVKVNSEFNYVRAQFIATESNQPVFFEQEMGNIQKQLELIGQNVEKNTKDISSVKQNIEELNKSGGRIINASTYKELTFNIINQLNTNAKKEELIIDLVNRFPVEVRQMLSVNSPGGEAFNILYSLLGEYGGLYSITLPIAIEAVEPLIQNIEKSNNPDLYALYLFRKLSVFIESASAAQRGAEVSIDKFIKLKEIGDQIISKFSESDDLNLMLRYHYYSTIMGYYNLGGIRRVYIHDLKTSIGFGDEMLGIYARLLEKKSFANKSRILDQINSGVEWYNSNGFGVPSKTNLHNSSTILIDYLYAQDPVFQKSLGFMPFTYKYIVQTMIENHQKEGGLDYLLKFCLKI
jgi:hypothetical protein